MSDFINEARKKLEDCRNYGTGPAGCMGAHVKEQLISFCEQNEEFAQAVVQGGSFTDCMKAVSKNVSNYLPDIEAYRRAAEFYFPGAIIDMTMTISMCQSERKGGGIVVDLASFL